MCSQLVRQAGELIYCDSTSSLDRYNCPTFGGSSKKYLAGCHLTFVHFHHFQSWLSWLWDAKRGIAKEHRQSIMMLVKSMLYTQNEQDIHQKYAIMKETQDSYTTIYLNLHQRLEQFWERRSEWALSYRVE